MAAAKPAWRNNSLSLRTKYEIMCLDPYDSFKCEDANAWKEANHKSIENLGQRCVVLLAYSRRWVAATTPLCFFYNWDAAEKALDLLMGKTNGVLDMRELLTQGEPEVDDDMGKEKRPIVLDGGGAVELNTTEVRQDEIPESLRDIRRRGPLVQVPQQPHPMIPNEDDQMHRVPGVNLDRYSSQLTTPVDAGPPRNGVFELRMDGVTFAPDAQGQIRVVGESNHILQRQPDGSLSVLSDRSSNGEVTAAPANQAQQELAHAQPTRAPVDPVGRSGGATSIGPRHYDLR